MAAPYAKTLQRAFQGHSSTQTLKQSFSSLSSLTIAPSLTSHQRTKPLSHYESQTYFFSTKSKQKKKSKEAETKLTYQQKKDMAKQRRRVLYQAKMERLDRLKTRRKNSPRDVLKSQFESWFLKRRDYQEIQEKLCKRSNKKWKVNIACVVERIPVVTPDKEEWEINFEEVQTYLAQFDRTYPADTPFGPPDPSDLPSGYENPMTMEDILSQLPENFFVAPRVTEADHNNDIHSLDRKLAERMYLIIKDVDPEQQIKHKNDAQVWKFPTTLAKEDETLVDGALRAAKEAFGEDMVIWKIGNCPMAADLFVYDDNQSEEYFGEKTFYFKVERDKGAINEDLLSKDRYAWLSREEIVEKVQEERGWGQATLHHYLL